MSCPPDQRNCHECQSRPDPANHPRYRQFALPVIAGCRVGSTQNGAGMSGRRFALPTFPTKQAGEMVKYLLNSVNWQKSCVETITWGRRRDRMRSIAWFPFGKADAKSLPVFFKEGASFLTKTIQTFFPGIPLPFAPVNSYSETLTAHLALGVGVHEGVRRTVINLAGTAARYRGDGGKQNQKVQFYIGQYLFQYQSTLHFGSQHRLCLVGRF